MNVAKKKLFPVCNTLLLYPSELCHAIKGVLVVLISNALLMPSENYSPVRVPFHESPTLPVSTWQTFTPRVSVCSLLACSRTRGGIIKSNAHFAYPSLSSVFVASCMCTMQTSNSIGRHNHCVYTAGTRPSQHNRSDFPWCMQREGELCGA